MWELTKKQNTEGSVKFCLTVPAEKVASVEAILSGLVSFSGESSEEQESFLSYDEALPESHAGLALAGARKNKGMNQQELAEALQKHGLKIKQPHISKIEQGNREISQDLANALGKILGVNPRVFLI